MKLLIPCTYYNAHFVVTHFFFFFLAIIFIFFLTSYKIPAVSPSLWQLECPICSISQIKMSSISIHVYFQHKSLKFLRFIFLLNAGFRWAVWGTLAREWHYSQAYHLQGIQPANPAQRRRGNRSFFALRALLHWRRRKQLQVKLFSLAMDFKGFLSILNWDFLFRVTHLGQKLNSMKVLDLKYIFEKLINVRAWHPHP